MDSPGKSSESCPKCGSHEIKVDRRYGSKLKGREVSQRVFRQPIYWVLFALVVLPSYFVGPEVPAQMVWRYIIPVVSLVVIIILNLRVYRQVSGGEMKFPASRSTCVHCGHGWDSAES